MTNGDGESQDVDSAGVYYLSVEDFEARSEPEGDVSSGDEPETSGERETSGAD